MPATATPVAPNARRARVKLPETPDKRFNVEDPASGLGLSVALRGARTAVPGRADGYLIFHRGHSSGATVLLRETDEGLEDLVAFESQPAVAEVAYDLALGDGVAGLRLVGTTLEALDAGGAPRLRVSPPAILAAAGARVEASLAVEGCAVDHDAAAPWGRPVVDPGSRNCVVRVSWPGDGLPYPALLDPAWTTTASMAVPRQGHTATVLAASGKVLVAGGVNASGTLASAELYDPATRTWAATGTMTGARQLHSAIQLGTTSSSSTSGKVLIAGGLNGSTSLNTAQLYSPSAGTWIAAGNLNAARHGHGVVLLSTGKVLVAGGLNGTATLQSAAIYDPSSGVGSWSATTGPIPPTGQRAFTAVLLATSNGQLNNKVLLPGGNSGTATLSAVYLFDPVQSAFSTLAAMPSARESYSATVLQNGKLLLAGGKSGTTVLRSAVIFDPSSGPGSWTTTGNMTVTRVGHTATLLSDGRVLVAGGNGGSQSLSSAELFTPTAGTWSATANLPAAVEGQTASLLASGLVLIAGGASNGTPVAAARLYDVTTGNACTSPSQCAGGFCVGGVCCDTACTDQCWSCTLSGSAGTCTPRANGTSCTDGNACTRTDTCQTGACTGSNPVVCTPSDQCHTASCNSANGACSNQAKPDGASCSDGNGCTQTDVCQAGSCTGTNPKVCTASDQCHDVGTCSPATGVCSNPAKQNGSTCQDGNGCTLADTCQSGACQPGTPKVCVASDQCHSAGTCAPSTGLCSNPSKTNGTHCDDGSVCTRNDTCQGAVCVGSSFAGNGVLCDDGDPCTQADVCQDGQCHGTTGIACTSTKIDGVNFCPGRANPGTASNQGWWRL